jgi:hypothetical protein
MSRESDSKSNSVRANKSGRRGLPPSKLLTGPASLRRSVCAPGLILGPTYSRPPRGDSCCRDSVNLPSTPRRTLPDVNSWARWEQPPLRRLRLPWGCWPGPDRPQPSRRLGFVAKLRTAPVWGCRWAVPASLDPTSDDARQCGRVRPVRATWMLAVRINRRPPSIAPALGLHAVADARSNFPQAAHEVSYVAEFPSAC